MEDIQRKARNNNHHALEPNKQPLALNQVARPAFTQFRNSVHASPEYTDGGKCKRTNETLESQASAQRHEDGVLVECVLAHGLVAAACANCEVDAEDHEDEEGEDLECETRYHDIVPQVWVFVRVGFGGCKTTARGLEEEGEEIAGDELIEILVIVLVCSVAMRLTIRVYASGLILEFSGPKAYTILLKHK